MAAAQKRVARKIIEHRICRRAACAATYVNPPWADYHYCDDCRNVTSNPIAGFKRQERKTARRYT